MNGEVKIGISNRHIHLSQQDLDVLFGENYKLTELKPLSQPGQYAAKDCVTLIGAKKTIQNVRILGPCRKQSQVEILMSDSYTLGVPIVVRESGDIAGTPGIYVAGPKGFIHLKEGVIVAKRHIHVSKEDALKMNLQNKEIVSVVCGNDRKTVFCETVVRVSEDFQTELHLDMDEANGCGIKNGMKAIIIK